MGKYNSQYLTVPVVGNIDETNIAAYRLLQLVGNGWEIVSSIGVGTACYYVLRKLTEDCDTEDSNIISKIKNNKINE